MNVTLDEGKYRIVIEDGATTVYRHGELWQDLTGDNLIFNLVHRITELTEAANEASVRLDKVSHLVNYDSGSAIDWLLENHHKNAELAEKLRDATEA